MNTKALMQFMKKISMLPKNKRGQTVDLIIATIVSIGIGVFVVFGILLGLSSLNPQTFFAQGSVEQNSTIAFNQNFTGGLTNFSDQLPTVFLVLGIVLIIAGIAVLLAFIGRFRQGSTGAGSL